MKVKNIVASILLGCLLTCGMVAGENAPIVSEEAKELAIISIEGYSQVQDAAIIQDDYTLSLALIVGWSTSEKYGKELGDNFVRLVKTFSPDDPPGKEIGEGIYNYIIGVYYPDESELALGAKVSYADHITW